MEDEEERKEEGKKKRKERKERKERKGDIKICFFCVLSRSLFSFHTFSSSFSKSKKHTYHPDIIPLLPPTKKEKHFKQP